MLLKNDPNYRRLNVGGRGLLNMASYWLGPDHLLVVEISNYLERYRRFYFRELLGISMRGTRRRLIWSLILMAPLVIVGVIAGVGIVVTWNRPLDSGEGAACAVVSGLGLVCLVLLAWNFARGQGCHCFVHTAVQTFRLPRVTRWRQAEGLVNALTPLIGSAWTSGAPAEHSIPPADTPGDSTPAADSGR